VAGHDNCSHPVIGWREWMSFPELEIGHIKAKIDTGARTSALHAFYVEPFHENGVAMVRFGIHPLQKRMDIALECAAPVLDQRIITDSGGHPEMRYVIETPVTLGDITWPIQVTLTNRDNMRFRMLLGRTALQERFLIDPSRSYLLGKKPPRRT